MTEKEIKAVDTTGLYAWLLERMAWSDFVEMCQRFGGQRVWIPRQPYIEDRNAEIRRRFGAIMEGAESADMTSVYESLARNFGMTERGIRHVLFDL
ncbi:MAG: Mor transcription activator family protein [Spirochaetota bacterium]|jgi:hypothetical protein|nr:Mor transcription activator family protein [Spirochaetota bacterium]